MASPACSFQACLRLPTAVLEPNPYSSYMLHVTCYMHSTLCCRARALAASVPQLSDHQQQWAQASCAKATAEGPADGITAAVLPHVSRRRSGGGGGGGGSGETGGVSPSSTHRGNLGRLLRSSSEKGEDGNCLCKERKVTFIRIKTREGARRL